MLTNATVSLAELHAACRRPENLNLYASLLLGDLFKHEFPPTHQAYWSLLVNAACGDSISGSVDGRRSQLREFSGTKDDSDFDGEAASASASETSTAELYYALGLPRGFAKTTLMKLFTTWLFAYTDFQFSVVVSATMRKAEFVVGDIAGFMDTANYKALFGNWRQKIEQDSMEQKIFHFNGKDRVLTALGAQGSIRGLNVKNLRPDAILLEDAQDKESAQSPVQNEAFLDWFLGTLLKAKSSERSFVCFIGNMYNEVCVLNKLRLNPHWISLISGALLANGESLWPEFRTKASLLNEYTHDASLGKGHIFLAEVMNDPTALRGGFFDLSQLKPYQFSEDLDANVVYGYFLIIDPATGKQSGDDTAIGVAAVINGKPVLMHVMNGKFNDEETVKLALRLALEWRASLIAVESVAYQVTLKNYIQRMLQLKRIDGIHVVECGPAGVSKAKRIQNAMLKWLTGEIDVHPAARPHVIAQATDYNPGKKGTADDILDVLAYMDPVLQEHWALLYLASDNNSANAETCGVAEVWETNAF